jgi:hypothetical protein
LAAKQADPDAINYYASDTRLADTCLRNNFHPTWIISDVTSAEPFRKSAAFSDAVGIIPTFPWFVDAPATATFRQIFGKDLPNLTPVQSPFDVSAGYAAGVGECGLGPSHFG